MLQKVRSLDGRDKFYDPGYVYKATFQEQVATYSANKIIKNLR